MPERPCLSGNGYAGCVIVKEAILYGLNGMGMTMKCPRCIDVELTHIHSILLDECSQCGGVWYDNDELRRAKDAEDPDLAWLDFKFMEHEDLCAPSNCASNCPACNSALVSLEYDKTGVVIDACPACAGIWLDAGEFASIMQSLEDEAVSMDLSDYLRAALREAREIISGPESRMSEWRDLKRVLRLMGMRLYVQKPKLVERMLEIQKRSPIQ